MRHEAENGFINVEDSERAATEAHARMLRNYDAWLKDLGAVLVDAIGAQITCGVDDLGRTLKEIYAMYKNRGTKPRMPKHTKREKT